MIKNNLEVLKSENKQTIKTLNESVQKFIQNNVNYVSGKGLGLYETEILKKDLIGMSLESQLRNEDVSATLGINAKDFCDSILENSQTPKFESILYTLYQISAQMLFFTFFQILLYSNFEIPISSAYIYIYIFYFAGVVTSNYFLPRFSFSSKWIKDSLAFIPFILITIAILFLAYFKIRVNIWFTVNWFFLSAVHLIIFLAMRLIWNTYINRAANNR